MKGYIKIYRRITENPIFQNEKALKIWIWLLLKANYKDNFTLLVGRQKIELSAGELVFGSNKACEELKISKSTIHFWLNFLKSERYIGRKKYSKFSVISISNWHKYQNNQGEELDTELHDKRTQGVPINETNKKYKNIKEESVALLKQYFISLCLEAKQHYAGSLKDEQRLRETLQSYSVEEIKQALKLYLERKEPRKVYSINAGLSAVSLSFFEVEQKKDNWQN